MHKMHLLMDMMLRSACAKCLLFAKRTKREREIHLNYNDDERFASNNMPLDFRRKTHTHAKLNCWLVGYFSSFFSVFLAGLTKSNTRERIYIWYELREARKIRISLKSAYSRHSNRYVYSWI